MKPLLLFAASLLLLSSCTHIPRVSTALMPDTTETNRHYLGYKAPLVNTPFIKLPVGSIEPKGWLLKELELMADGYFGHLGEISQFLVKENNSWLSTDGTGDHGWEELPYWLKGYSNLAWILGRDEMKDEARSWIDAVFESQQEDGWFGPDKGRTGAATDLTGREDLWPNMIMLFILQDYYSYSKDKKVIKLMTRYFDYLMTIPEDKFLVGYWPANRGGDLLYSIYWLYNHTENPALLDLAAKVHRKSVNWTDGIPDWHNVNMSQSFGEPATWYLQSRDEQHMKAAERNFNEIRSLYGQVPGGMFGSDENCRKGYTDPRQAIETCGMVEMMLSTETLLAITGDPAWADRCEDVAFNSYPAALTADKKALRYLTSPNQVQSDAVSKSPGVQNGGPMFLMSPHRHRCCQHNQGHGWPYFAQHLWLATADNGLAAVLYAENEVEAKVGYDTKVKISVDTKYPFEEEIRFRIKTKKSVRFPLYLRIPAWCSTPEVKMNGKSIMHQPASGYIKIELWWKSGDEITLNLPMKVGTRTWEANKNSVSVDYGPLTFSLKIEENYVREGGTDEWPTWEIFPASQWNYGLALTCNPENDFRVIKKDYPENDMPFTHEGAPIEIKTSGALIPDWGMDETNLVKELPVSPVVTDQPRQEVTLIPMGAARLRVSAFPVLGDKN